MILIIDTTDRNIVKTSIFDGENIKTKKSNPGIKPLMSIYPLIDNLLKDCGNSIKDIEAIAVNPGPGSYTSTRIGVTVANTLAWRMNIPIYDIDKTAPKQLIIKLKSLNFRKSHFSKPIYPQYHSDL